VSQGSSGQDSEEIEDRRDFVFTVKREVDTASESRTKVKGKKE
jgi:hypothetical protein